jgi:hypothetical protein
MAGVSGEFTVKSADTDVSALIVNVQVVAVPEHAPPHELKVESEAGVSVKVTIVPASTEAGQVVPPQVIVPEPVLETDGEIVMLYEVEEDATAPSVVPPPVLSAGGVCPVEVFDTAPSVVPPPVEPSGGGVPVEVFDTAAFVRSPPVLSAGGVCPVEVFDTAPSVVPPPVEPVGGGVPIVVFDTAASVVSPPVVGVAETSAGIAIIMEKAPIISPVLSKFLLIMLIS